MLKALDIEIAVARYFNTRVNLIVPNISWGLFIHECDLLIITKNNYAYEVEIKVSKADLIKDQKKRHSHNNEKIKKLYFAIPDYLLKYQQHIPEQAGILVIKKVRYNDDYNDDTRLFCEQIREAKVKSEYRFTDDEKFNVARLGTMRIWNLKSKIREMRDVAFWQGVSLYQRETINMKKDKRLEAVKENCYNRSSSLTKKIVLALCKEGLSNLSYSDYFAKVIERAIKLEANNG